MPDQDVAVEIFYDGAWHDLVPLGDVDAWNGEITITRGQGDESAAFRPAQIMLQLANDDDKYRTSNPESLLYGKAGRNTPIRVSVGGTVRGIAEASSWAPDQDPEFQPGSSPQIGRAWVDVEAGGLLQRVGQWSDPLRSPMYRQISSYSSLTGYWPLEDPSGSTRLSQLVPLATQGVMVGTVNLAADTGALGSEANPTLGTDGAMNGRFRTSPASGWQVCWAMRLTAVPGGAGYNTMFRVTDTSGRTWAWNMNNINIQVVITDASGTTLETSTAVLHTGQDLTGWCRFRLRVTISGGTITYEPAWYEQNDPTPVGFTDTFAATTTAQPRTWQASFNSYTDGAAYGHVFAITDVGLDIMNAFDVKAAFNGYIGETAGARFTRLTGELGLTSTVLGTSATSYPMGPQTVATFPDLLKEIVTTEDGLVFDDIDAVSLVFLLRGARYNQTPALDLVPTDLPALPREVTDDLDVHNVVTVTNRGGGDFTAVDDTGPLGTQDPPDGAGIYRQTVDVNVAADDDLEQVANWWLHRGTVDLPRFPQITIDLNGQPGLIADVESVDVGSVITISGWREYTVRLFVLGWVETIGTHSRLITFTCAPDQQFVTGEWDDGVVRWDSASTILHAAATSSATALTFATANPNDRWSTTHEPYDVLISGERVTVTSMGAADHDAALDPGTFENPLGVTGWSVSGGAIAQSSTFADTGTFSARLTVSGSPTQAYIRNSAAVSVVEGFSYTATMRCRTGSTLTVSATIDWLDAAGNFLSRSISGSSLASGAFATRTVTDVAPTGAVQAQYGSTITGSPANGSLLYTDSVTFTAAIVLYQDATVTRSVNGIVKALPVASGIHIATPGRWGL